MKKSILSLLCLVLIVSCNKTTVYDRFDDGFLDNRWEQKDIKTYDFTIDDATKLYNVTFRFSHVYDYQFSNVPINFTIINPKGEVQKKQINLQIKDVSGKELAECSGDFCDLNYQLEENVTLLKGNYKLIISHSFEGPYMPNILGIGLKVEATK